MSLSPLPFKLIFVTGSMRSGTSLLHRLISTSPDAGERLAPARYIMDFIQLFHTYSNSESAFVSDYAKSNADFLAVTRQFVTDRLHDAWLHSGKPACLVLRTVEVAPTLPLVARLLPEAKFAVSVREPKDVIASILKVGEKQRKFWPRRETLASSKNLSRMCRTYNRAYLATVRTQRSDEALRKRIVFVRYEDAVADPAGALRDLWRRFDIAPGSTILTADSAKRTSIRQIMLHKYWRSYKTDLSEAPISAASIGSHKSALKASEIWAINWRCRILRRLFQYSGGGGSLEI
ncbi:sulfotransferase family protein [Mesorhizobium shangrilense]|uniref:Sulfotransferase n=1 Tax=Mesorhizobium shangrilense TaxID=460060 RepID=A0ABV2D5W5_9HYPH